MADQVLSVVGFVSKKLLTLLLEEGNLLGGLRQEVQLISDEFGHMKAFLEVVESRKENDPRLAEWIRQVREAACDTEDVIDEFTFLLFAGHRPRARRLQWSFKSIKDLPARHQLASKLQSIKGRIKNISDARLRYESGSDGVSLAANDPWRWRQSKDDDALLVEESQLIGIEGPKKHLISHLLQGESPLKVIAVLGMGGLGKTTLVRKVHEHVDVKHHFQIHAWVTVSQTCDDLPQILKGLIRQLRARFKKPVPAAMEESMDLYQLKALVRDFLRRARYLIVFDDVWDRELWDAFRYVLPNNSFGGNRVMLTTRIADVAESCTGPHGHVYRMECLSVQDSWTLFCRKTFKDNSCPAYLENAVEGIVGKCQGLPLAIVAIGGLLASKDLSRMDEWERVGRRLRDEIEGTGQIDKARKILRLSYDDLSPTLKTCLLYISIYPEDYKIGYNHLMQLWIAERFVEPGRGLTADQLAWEYLKNLVNRSLIQVSEILYDGLPRYCHVHDLLREVIVSESREQNMITIFSPQQQTRTRWSSEKVRRLVFNKNLLHISTTHESHHHFKNLRSIFSFGRTEQPSKALLTKLLCSKLLKILDLRGLNLEEIPEEIFNLFHLAYLCISGERVTVVPKSIKRIQNLESLDLRRTNVKELPTEILKLQKLRHLLVYQQVDSYDKDLGYYGFKAPREMGKLLELQTLANIDAIESGKNGILNEIGNLAQLRKVGVANLRREDGKELCSSLEKLTNLQALRVGSLMENDEVTVLDLNHPLPDSSLQSVCWLLLTGRLERMPPWISNLKRLGRINLNWSSLLEDPLESLQHLPNLIEISLSHQAYQGESLRFKAGGFLKLKKLCLKSMKGLRWVRIEDGAMPHVKHVVVEQLPLLEELPWGIQNLGHLQKLELWDLSPQITKKLENEGLEDNRKIFHIPQVLINGLQRDGGWSKKTDQLGQQTQEAVVESACGFGASLVHHLMLAAASIPSAFPSQLILKLSAVLFLVFFILFIFPSLMGY